MNGNMILEGDTSMLILIEGIVVCFILLLVCVPCAVNRNGLSIAKVANLGRVSTKNLHSVYDGRIKEDATICTDKMNSYKRFASKTILI